MLGYSHPMFMSTGILAAFVAMLCWGIGDFLIQRSTRRLGNWETLFVIEVFGTLALFPFVYKNLSEVFFLGNALLVLCISATVLFFAAFLEFEALRRGKISVVEPLWSLEIPLSALLALFILGERLSIIQSALVALLVIGLLLVSLKGRLRIRNFLWERGVFLSLVAAVVMSAANFFIGLGGRLTDPLMVNFFIGAVIAIVSGCFLLCAGRLPGLVRDVKAQYRLLLPMAIMDNVAWVAFTFAMFLAPIGVAVALSESYIIIAVILGLSFGHERLTLHQKIGLVIALISVLWLAIITA